jgi:hypothetical protein
MTVPYLKLGEVKLGEGGLSESRPPVLLIADPDNEPAASVISNYNI